MSSHYEAEILPGLKEYALGELNERVSEGLKFLSSPREDRIRFSFPADPRRLLTLRTVVAVYLLKCFAVPRPRALLGDQAFAGLLEGIQQALALNPAGAFDSFRISAAGRDSSVMRRISDSIAEASGLRHDDREGALLLRIIPGADRKSWEVLVRLTPRPLATRPWRVCDMPGALNATIAAAMLRIIPPGPQEKFLNLMCGSGTLMIERKLQGSQGLLCGGDISTVALQLSRRNTLAAGAAQTFRLCRFDARNLPFADESFDILCADLPWGERVGKRSANKELYRRTLLEAARVIKPSGILMMVTQEHRLLSDLLSENPALWSMQHKLRVFQGGYHPHVYFLRREA